MEIYRKLFPQNIGDHVVNSQSEKDALIADWESQGIDCGGLRDPHYVAPAIIDETEEIQSDAPVKRGPGRPRKVVEE